MSIQFQNSQETRYDRQKLISWWEQERLSRARIIVAGAGALGNEVLKLLALTGVGHITVIDYDVINPSNLARMVLFRESDIGKSKVEVAVHRLRDLNPEIEVTGLNGDLRFDLGLGSFRQANLVIGCLDSIHSRWALNRKCHLAGVEWIDGGISDFHGSVARYTPENGACYECNFTEITRRRFDERYSCPFGLLTNAGNDRVPSSAITSSLIAALQVQQALLTLHGEQDQSLKPGERLTFYCKPFHMVRDRLPYNPDCLAHEVLPKNLDSLPCSPETSLNDTLKMAQKKEHSIQALQLPYDFLVAFDCTVCSTTQPVMLPQQKVYQDAAYCPNCKQLRTPRFLSSVHSGTFEPGTSLGDIGIPPHEIIGFETARDGLKYFQMTG